MKAHQSQSVKVIGLKDRAGRVTSTKEVITYQGLLSKAHDEGLDAIRTSLLQIPAGENSRQAIVKAEVQTKRGHFEAPVAPPGDALRAFSPAADSRGPMHALRYGGGRCAQCC